MISGMLVIIPCGAGKIWDTNPNYGPCRAKDAYTGAPFIVNRKYAEKFANKWLILSAKYGYIVPQFKIPGDYNVTFKDNRTNPVDTRTLVKQIHEMGLVKYNPVIGLGGKEYRDHIYQSFRVYHITPQFPFADLGLKIGESMSLIKECIAKGNPYPVR